MNSVSMGNKKNVMLWIVSAALAAAFVLAFAAPFALDVKVKLALLCLSLPLSLFCASKTSQGIEFMRFWNGAVFEIKKVVWPTQQETTTSLIAVGVMVTVMCILIAIIDSIYGKLFSYLLA